MTLTALTVPMLSDNYAWILRDDATGSLAFVDPADAEAGAAVIEAIGGKLDLILLTHHHDDHIAGADALRRRYGAKIVGAAADAHRLPPLDTAVTEGDRVTFSTYEGQVIDTPGHTVGHISFFFPNLSPGDPILFCGDTMFSLGCGRMFEGTAEQFFASFHKIAALPPQTLICCGHEYTQSNARFALSVDPDNTLLQAKAAQVDRMRAAGQQTLPVRLADELPVNPYLLAKDAPSFGRLRSMKDSFKG
jgi:hydroxyacylglutathione hydrolase